MRHLILIGTLASLSSWSNVATARTLQCDHEQHRCVTESTDLAIGDRVGIFNDDHELVAKGEVIGMRGERRAVEIDRRYGVIRRTYTLALLDKRDGTDYARPYTIYHQPAKIDVGAGISYANVSIGNSSPGTEATAYAAWRAIGGLQLVGRGVYLSTSGMLMDYSTPGNAVSRTIAATGIGLLGGAAYSWRENQLIGFRAEAGAGMMQVNATIDGHQTLVNADETNAHIQNGLLPYGRWSMGTVVNLDAWRLHLAFTESLVSQAFANMLGVAVSHDIK